MRAVAGVGSPNRASIATEHIKVRRQNDIVPFLSCLLRASVSTNRRLWCTLLTLATARDSLASRYGLAAGGDAFDSSGVPSTRIYRLQPRQSRTSKPSRSSAEVTAYTSPQRHSWEKLPPFVSSKIIPSNFTLSTDEARHQVNQTEDESWFKRVNDCPQ